MKMARLWALLALVLLGTYHLLRYAATRCAGSGCDVYIPLSILIPLLSWIAAVASGLIRTINARSLATKLTFGALTASAGVGPMVSLFVFRDSPDALVPLVTVILAIVPLAVLVDATGEVTRSEPV